MKLKIKYIFVGILIFVLAVLTRILLNKYDKDGFTDKKKLAILLRGESFRTGSQLTRVIGGDESFESQKEASATHNKLAEKIESLGYEVDIYIDTYSTKYDNDLLSWYGSRVKSHVFNKTHLESQKDLMKDLIGLLDPLNYDAILIIRLDLFLKEPFITEYNPDTQTIQFISVLFTRNHKTPKNRPMVNDTIFHFPKKYYDNNVINLITFLDACVAAKIKNFIFASTCAVYKSTKNLCVSEDDDKKPQSIYGRSKYFGEDLIKSYSKLYKFNYSI